MTSRSRDGRPDPVRVVLFGLATVVGLGALGGCPGHLGPEFPANLEGSGGNASTGGDSGNGGDTGTGGAGMMPCDAPTMVFQGSCAAIAGCHTATDTLALVGADIEKALIGKKSIQTGVCDGMNLVNPTPPADGVFFKVLTGTSCGARMPFGGDPLTQEQMSCITAWINSKL